MKKIIPILLIISILINIIVVFCLTTAKDDDKSRNGKKGKLGHSLGTYLTIEAVRAERKGKSSGKTLVVDKVNGKKLNRPVHISIQNTNPLPNTPRLILRGYESGKMIGIPDEVTEKENLQLEQAVWQFYHYFIVTSVVEPSQK